MPSFDPARLAELPADLRALFEAQRAMLEAERVRAEHEHVTRLHVESELAASFPFNCQLISADIGQFCLILRGFPFVPGNPSYRTRCLADKPGGFMVNKPLNRRHGDAGAPEFAASSRVSPASANGGKRP